MPSELSPRAASAGHDVAAFDMSERGRARELLRLLAAADVDLTGAVPAELVDRLRLLQRQADELAARVAPAPSGARADVNETQRQLNLTLAEIQEVRGRTSASHAGLASLVEATLWSARDVQSTVIATGEVMLVYELGTERSYVWTVTSERFRGVSLAPRKEIEPAARRLHTGLQARNDEVPGESPQVRRRRLAGVEAQIAADVANLSDVLLDPVAETLASAQRVIVVADGELGFVPSAS